MNNGQIDAFLRTFPKEVEEGNAAIFAGPELLKRYRDDLTDYAGVAIFLFGNKLQDGQVVLSDGVAQEFEIAKEKGLALIPVGATGFMAKQLWDKVMANSTAYYPKDTAKFKPMLDILGDAKAEPGALIDAVVGTLDLWAKS